ncbi:(2Fe-2S)-binding protein [Rhizobium laguerreae]|uniref:(2Fe-2S)-binding protein n=1 Tax=Rhizobium laguerreae TaxID=1076926 RepID=UPI001C919974|nr:(2Fe-2S)-binding protein [Rhizobium laguerreae]MBY3258802.1 (2Fe-2S)-binding protein [Rhizobium laguerreae]MBY3282057.1 (2Fe-2S)-binding protein [Rhizobium laguerreae]MBY3293347.1 (2Fe-2S)-binding protein [Rhizobium laguerreae]
MSGQSFGQFLPVHEIRSAVTIYFNGLETPACVGESVIAAVLRSHGYLGFSEFDGAPRAGFCLMGACQDCSLWLQNGRRIRACMTTVEPGMTVASRPPLGHEP